MSDLFWLTDEQIERLRPFTGRLPLDERQVLAEAADRNAIGERRILVGCCLRVVGVSQDYSAIPGCGAPRPLSSELDIPGWIALAATYELAWPIIRLPCVLGPTSTVMSKGYKSTSLIERQFRI